MYFAVKNCGTISHLDNGIVTGNIYTVNGTLLLECLPHTHMAPEVYNMTTTCNTDGMWVPGPPTKCESKLYNFVESIFALVFQLSPSYIVYNINVKLPVRILQCLPLWLSSHRINVAHIIYKFSVQCYSLVIIFLRNTNDFCS